MIRLPSYAVLSSGILTYNARSSFDPAILLLLSNAFWTSRALVQSSGSGALEGRSGEALEECPVRRKWDTRQSSLEGTSSQRANPLLLPRGLDRYFLVVLFAFAAAFSALAAE